MNDGKAGDLADGMVFEYDLEETPQKVWRAITIPELREHWLPGNALAEPEAASITPGEEVQYRMRASDPPFLESVVTFKIAPNAIGGTSLRVIHELVDGRAAGTTMAANDNRPFQLRAA